MTKYEVSFKPSAIGDITAAGLWYRSKGPTLALAFLGETRALVSRIASNPESYPLVYKDFRHALTRRFPYRILFRIDNGKVQIFAVLHQHQYFQRVLRRRGPQL